MSKQVLMEIDNVRIVKVDDRNVMIERRERSINPKTKEEKYVWRFKGFYGTVMKALRAIVTNGLLVDEREASDMRYFYKKVEESNQKVLVALEG